MSNLPGYSSNAIGNSSGTESGKPIKDMSGYGRSNKPTPYVPSAGAGGGDTGNTPGTYEISPFDAGGSAARAYDESEGLLVGLRNTLFGLGQTDSQGKHGGVVGDIPLLGDAGRGVSDVIGNVGSAAVGVAGKAVDVVGGALEHVDLRSSEEQAKTQRLYDLLPAEYRSVADEAIAKDPGAAGHFMAKAINEYEQSRREEGDLAGGAKPEFTTGAFKEAGSAAEAFDNVLASLGLGARAMERKWTEVATPGQGGMDRLGVIMAVGSGQTNFNEDKGLLGTGFLQGEQTGGGRADK